jgi:ubiquinone/menaquinone biosynthesis C-methylase UbiE
MESLVENKTLRSSTTTPFLSRFLKLFFHLLYHQFAWSYDLVAWIVSAGAWREWETSLVEDIQGGRVLELGYGPGHLQVAFHRKGACTIGLDASMQMAFLAFRRIVRSGFSPLLVIGYAQLLPFDNSCIDHLIASFPTNYILDPDTLSEAFRVLKPSGDFTVLPLARPTGSSAISSALNWLFRITGQAPGNSAEKVLNGLQATYSDSFNQAGFNTHIAYRRVSSGELWIIHAIKPA